MLEKIESLREEAAAAVAAGEDVATLEQLRGRYLDELTLREETRW